LLVDAANGGVAALLATVASRSSTNSGASGPWVVNQVDEKLRLKVSSKPGAAAGSPRVFKAEIILPYSAPTVWRVILHTSDRLGWDKNVAALEEHWVANGQAAEAEAEDFRAEGGTEGAVVVDWRYQVLRSVTKRVM
jgi:hypothetical protein